MKPFGSVARVVAVFTVLFALLGMRSGAFAQDAAGTPVADAGTAAVSYYVGVSCGPAGDGSQTACSFTATASDGSAIEALWVPASIACSAVVDSGGSNWTGDGYQVEAAALTLTFAGSVGPGSGAGYVVRVNGADYDVAGEGVVCSDPAVGGGGSVATDPSANGTTGSADGSETTGGAANATDVGATPQPTEVGAVDGTPTPDTTGGGSPAETPTGDVTGNGSGPGTADVSGAAAPQSTVDVTVVVYNCSADPGAADVSQSDNCTPADQLTVTATEDSKPSQEQKTSGGITTFFATIGSTLVLSEEVPANYQPIGNGSLTIDQVRHSATVLFVNVAAGNGQGNGPLGRLQIVHGTCPTGESKPTLFKVIPPKSFQAQAAESCGPTPGTFTITGGSLGGGSVQAATDGNGVWQGYLPPGLYTISESAGSVSDVPIVADDLTAVVAIDYAVADHGSLTISKVVCSQGNSEIDVLGAPPAADPACAPADGNFSLASDKQITFSLGNDGVITLPPLPVGSYTLTDLDSGAQPIQVSISKNAATYVYDRTVQLHGSLVVQHFFCGDPASNDADRSSTSYWKDHCSDPTGGAVTLSDGGGDPIDTRSGQVITWDQLVPGSYSVAGDDGTCATFAGNTDARGGFDISADATTHVYLYTCAAPVDSGPGGTSAGGDGSGGGGNGGDGGSSSADGNAGGNDGAGGNGEGQTGGVDTGNSYGGATDAQQVASVTQLPDTGTIGSRRGDGLDSFELLILALPALLAMAAIHRRRAR
jgi:hypothetical protein